MLGDRDATATLAVSDLDRAKAFYEGVLGLSPAGLDAPDAVVYRSGNTTVLVYRSAYAGTNQATAVSWAVGDDFDRVVEELRGKDVVFERYDDLPGTTREGDVHLFGDMKAVWFRDPDGNILNVGSM